MIGVKQVIKRKAILLMVLFAALIGGGYFYISNRQGPSLETKFVQETRKQDREEKVTEENGWKEIQLKEPGEYVLLNETKQAYQTFNNCGPATLSMILSYYGVYVSQKELGDKMRPYQNPKGDNDDKTIFTYEFAEWIEKYGLRAKKRVNGDIELLKLFLANEIPIVVKTWLRVDEDIGHFRIVRGFDEAKGVIIQGDSYHGPNKKIPYFDLLLMWQPFNYDYIVVYKEDQEEIVMAILGEEKDENVAYQNALEKAKKERNLDPQNIYPVFNFSTANYHLGNYEESVRAFEEVESRLPKRMLWYQIEPIRSYFELGDYSRVLQIIDRVLNTGNRAFSELYQIRGEVYLAKGEKEKVKEQFELALFYNKNFSEAKISLEKLNSLD